MGKVICLVTIHGIGFEQAPRPPDVPGYADPLHQNLSKYLNENETMLGDDPNRERGQRGENGPVYVQSWYPPGQQYAKSGLSRLGDWTGPTHQAIDASNAPLVNGDQRIAHVALVYSHLEEVTAKLGAAFIAGAMVSASALHYAHVTGLVQMLIMDSIPLLQRHEPAHPQPSPSLRIRNDLATVRPAAHMRVTADQTPTGLLAVLRELENDVAAYVCRNELRERVRYFVLDALLRLVSRDDVEAIVINSHSNGTVVGLDVMRQLPPYAAEKVKAFVTAGSPLRKYIDLFVWGQQVESLNPIKPWINFWDEKDPVADPLAPPATWHVRDGLVPPFDPGLFQHINPNTGKTATITVEDRKVDNVTYSKDTDLKAHNYWDNDTEFVKPLADILKDVATGKEVSLNAAVSAS
jgi:hypothetical protein